MEEADQGISRLPEVEGDRPGKVKATSIPGEVKAPKLVCGGKRVGNNGYFIQPTVFADVQEIFGSVMSVIPFKISTR
jgi:aldehyde dehydrogenase (NAD+)